MHFMDKKGILAKHMVTLLIAAIGIGLILAGVGKLYAQVREGKESEKAQGIINSVEAKIKALNDEESSELTVNGLGGWTLRGFSETDEHIPEKCFYESCVCVCKMSLVKFGRINLGEVAANQCQANGFCRQVEKKKVMVSSIILSEKTTFAPQSMKPELESRKVENIGLDGSFIKLVIEKSKDSLKISADLRDGEK